MSTWFEIVITALVGIYGLYLSWANYKKGKDELFYKLFTYFNNRYNEKNEKLYKLLLEENNTDFSLNSKLIELKEKHYNLVIDYLNLCAEEFLWVNKKYIDKDVWKSWQKGIMWWHYKSKVIQSIWNDEQANIGSYYTSKGRSFIIKEN